LAFGQADSEKAHVCREKEATLEKRSGRVSRAWFTFYFIMALIALPASAFNWGNESFGERLLFFFTAVFIVLGVLSAWVWGSPKESNKTNYDEDDI
jgi:predicted nucleic acid-binding Zn ribbon protein